jgi:acyl carrier protein
VEPRTETEAILAGIWAEVLGLDRVGVADNFFELGGHSLLATQVISRACARFELQIPLKALFEEPTLVGFADYISTLEWSRRGASGTDMRETERIRI